MQPDRISAQFFHSTIEKGEYGNEEFRSRGLGGKIVFNPKTAIKIEKEYGSLGGKPLYSFTGEAQTPALGLFHELGHAYNYFHNPIAYMRRTQIADR